jgi:hypothetical protein
MSTREPVLRAIRSQVQFELVQAAAEVVQAAEQTTRARNRVVSLQRRAGSFLRELRQIMGRPQLNAALLDTMRRCHRVEQSELREWQTREAAAQQHEQQARSALAGLRNQERSLERALQAERRKRQLRIQTLEMIRADELWLQHSLQEFR